MFPTYHDSVKFLESLSNLSTAQDYMSAKQGSVFYLKRSQELVKRLKINLNQFKFIHIAGTSGKGSTTAMLHQVLLTAGKKVGSYYSPHPTTSIERIKVNSLYIDPSSFSQLLDQIKPYIADMILKSPFGRPSYFELFFALALLYFQKTKCEYVILETGCGGEFDATNIINQPLITAITNIGLDHVSLLGKTLSKIAKTKAEIIKPGSLFLTSEARPHLLKIFKQICQRKRAKFVNVSEGDNYNYRLQNMGVNFNLPLISQVQHANAMLAYQIARHLKIKSKLILKGLKNFHLPCRFEIIQNKPTVILDGAHNFDKIKSTVNNLKKIKTPIMGKHSKLTCIFTISHNKDIHQIVGLLAPHLDQVLLTKHFTLGRKCADLKVLHALFIKYNKKIKAQIMIDPWQALAESLKQASPQDIIIVTGSFYLAGELRKKWISEEKILRSRKPV